MNELKPIAIALLIAGMGTINSTQAAPVTSNDLDALSARIDTLEASRDSNSWADNISIGGIIEANAYKVDKTSDLYTATVELSVEASVNDFTTAQVVLLTEDIDATTGSNSGVNVDSATITINLGTSYITVGQMWLPFGRFETYQISDPLTLQMGESYNSALQLGFDMGGVYGSLYAFNGESQRVTDDNKISHYGANLGFIFEKSRSTLDVGVSYINSIAESGLISSTLDPNAVPVPVPPINALTDLSAGISFHAIADLGPFSMIFEQVKASDDVAGPNTQLTASNVEMALHLEVAGKEATVAVSTQKSSDAAWVSLPEKANLATLSMQVLDATNLSVEFSSQEDYAGVKSTMTGLQLAVEF